MTFFAQYRKAIVTRLVGVMLVTVCVLFSSVPFAQLPEGESAKLVVGALELPPFSMKTMEGTWEGLSFDLLDLIAAELDIEYEVREFTDVKVHRRALSEGGVLVGGGYNVDCRVWGQGTGDTGRASDSHHLDVCLDCRGVVVHRVDISVPDRGEAGGQGARDPGLATCARRYHG